MKFSFRCLFFAFFSKTTRQICAKFFSGFRRKHLVYYNLHWKALHPAFNKKEMHKTSLPCTV